MNTYANEDLMWQRLKDAQREAENRRLYSPSSIDLIRLLVERAWLLAGLAMRRPPRRSWSETRSRARSRVA